MATVLAFDVYGTLIDTHGVVTELEERLGASGKAELAAEFSRRWRDKQLEYSFRRGLMGAYVAFSQCTREALEFTDRALQTRLADVDKPDGHLCPAAGLSRGGRGPVTALRGRGALRGLLQRHP